ncbi:MAG: hypothetical protein MAG451_00747 [Anaerolineales bacterium]|nr:hypothetical protein [Anaerolineales bacterium]
MSVYCEDNSGKGEASFATPEAGLIVLAISVVTYFTMVVLEGTGLLPPADVDATSLTIGSAIVTTVMLILVSLAVRLLNSALGKALQEAQQRAVELAATTEQLQAAAEGIAATTNEMAQGAETQARQAETASRSMAQLANATRRITSSHR